MKKIELSLIPNNKLAVSSDRIASFTQGTEILPPPPFCKCTQCGTCMMFPPMLSVIVGISNHITSQK